MIRNRLLAIFVMLILCLSCEEEELGVQDTATSIGFSFFKDKKGILPDSVKIAGTDKIRIYTKEDSTGVYQLPLKIHDQRTEFSFYFDTIQTDVFVEYERELINDIDKIRYYARLKNAGAENIDSLKLDCGNNIYCETNEAILKVYF